MLKSLEWPLQARRVTDGFGECLGATYDPKGPRLGRATSEREELCKLINKALASALGDAHFQWGSLQVNVNFVSW